MGEFSSKDISNLDPYGMVHLPLWNMYIFLGKYTIYTDAMGKLTLFCLVIQDHFPC